MLRSQDQTECLQFTCWHPHSVYCSQLLSRCGNKDCKKQVIGSILKTKCNRVIWEENGFNCSFLMSHSNLSYCQDVLEMLRALFWDTAVIICSDRTFHLEWESQAYPGALWNIEIRGMWRGWREITERTRVSGEFWVEQTQIHSHRQGRCVHCYSWSVVEEVKVDILYYI